MTILNNILTNSMIILSKLPLGERMKTATLNTALGMGTVFLVLIFITFIISLFKYLPGLFEVKKTADIEQEVKNTSLDNTIAQIVSQEEANLMNDKELIAVITAAISAYQPEYSQDVAAGGFIVRSIRKY